MALPIPTNNSADIYRVGNSPPAAPDVAGVQIHLGADFPRGQTSRESAAIVWTHLMLAEISVDVRDGYVGTAGTIINDMVYVPDKDGTPFRVVFVERRLKGTPNDHLRVYLDRVAPPWPTAEL